MREVAGILEATDVFASAAADEIGETLEERNVFRIAPDGNEGQQERRLLEHVCGIVGLAEQTPEVVTITGLIEQTARAAHNLVGVRLEDRDTLRHIADLVVSFAPRRARQSVGEVLSDVRQARMNGPPRP